MGAGASTSNRGGEGIFETAPIANTLGKLQQMTNGHDWIRSDGWNDDDGSFGEPNFKTYFGLGVNKYSNVIRISLPRNNLSGILPFKEKFVSNMIELRTIDFGNNHIGGEFPTVWCRLYNLTDLDLSQNHLRGTFPDAMGNMIHLKSLKLGSNQFHGRLPITMSKLTMLTHLELHRNRLCGRPDMLGNCFKLHTLKLSENQFTGELPEEWIMLEVIRELYIFSNKFTLFSESSQSETPVLTPNNYKLLEVLRKRCHILVMMEDQVGDGGFIADRLPDRKIWPHQPHLYGNGFTSVKLRSHDSETMKMLRQRRTEDREL